MNKNNFLLFVLLVLVAHVHTVAQPAVVGGKLPAWQEGCLDLHHINTGRGNSMYAIMPDGTTMIVDAGELSPLDERTFTARNASIRPDSTRKPFEWIERYISRVMPLTSKGKIDFAVITHFHDDHFGAWYPDAPTDSTGRYRLTGIAGVGSRIPFKWLFDRGYPEYDYPYSLKKNSGKHAGGEIQYDSTMLNYFRFLDYNRGAGVKMEPLQAGSASQIRMMNKHLPVDSFHIRVVKVNGLVWNGKDSLAKNVFPDTFQPDENSLSIALLIRYGNFAYYTGGDNAGNVFPGDHPARDVETPIADAVGEVDVATMDHHGNRDALNEYMIGKLSATAWIGQTWSADHPGHEVLMRLTNKITNPQQSHLFATNMLEANKLVIGSLIDRSYKSQQGHVVVRVLPGGRIYYIIVVEDVDESMKVRSVFGPYHSKTKD